MHRARSRTICALIYYDRILYAVDSPSPLVRQQVEALAQKTTPPAFVFWDQLKAQ